MAMNQPFTTASPVLANYSSTEIQSGIGYEDYYLFVSKNNTTENYVLSKNIVRSISNETKIDAGSSGGGAATVSLDFDTSPLSMVRTINGTAIATGTMYVEGSGSGHSSYMQISIYKYDGTTETLLGSGRTQSLGQGNTQFNFCLEIDIDNKIVNFGDVLRVKVSAVVVAEYGDYYFGTDPLDRDGANIIPSSEDATTQTKITIPYKLDL